MKNIFYTIAAACILSTTSCEHKNLCYDHAHTGIVNVVFDWRNAPERRSEIHVVLSVSDRRRRGFAL